jgi:hypothetical protein
MRASLAIRHHTTSTFFICAFVGLCGSSASSVTVSLFDQSAGRTPQIVGYGVAHYMPGSNVQTWWKYSGVNGARIWSSPGDVEATDDLSPYGDNVTTQTQFIARRTALRANPLSSTYIDWNDFNNAYANNTTTGNNTMKLQYAAQSLTGIDNELLIVMQRRVGSWSWPSSPTGNSSTNWKDRWEAWQHWYAQAFYYAKNFDSERFQMYNEPDHSNADPLTQAQWLEQLQYASDAIAAAISDVNTLYGKSLIPRLNAAVTSGGPDLDAGEYGRLALDNLHRPLFSTADVPSYNLFQTFTYHQYTSSATNFGDTLTDAIADVRSSTGNPTFPVAISEFNVYTNASWPSTLTADSPSVYKDLGDMVGAAANASLTSTPKELFLFKFGLTGNANGTHYFDDNNSPYNVGGVTKSGQVYHLFAKGFADQELLVPPTASGFRLAASQDAAAGLRYLFATHNGTSTSSQSLEIDLSPWNIAPGTQIVVEQVSERYHGDVSQLITVPANRLITVIQSADSTALLSVPTASSLAQVSLTPTDDAMVVAGANANANFGTIDTMNVQNNASSAILRSAGLLKFDLGGIDPAIIRTAVLKLTGVNPDTAGLPLIGHLYGLTSDSWNESTVTWNNAPNLGTGTGNDGSGAVTEIRDNFVEGLNSSADVIGQFTADGAEGAVMIDVAEFLRTQGDRIATFLLTRDVRFDGDVDTSTEFFRFRTKEHGNVAFRPELLLQIDAPPVILESDFNQDGVVDGGDLDIWASSFGISSIGDANEDGQSDGADFLIWQRQFGVDNLTQVRAIPEPSASVLMIFTLAASQVLMSCRHSCR